MAVVDPNEPFRRRREERRRRIRRRRIAALALLAVLGGGVAALVVSARGKPSAPQRPVVAAPVAGTIPHHVAPPSEIRGVHVPMTAGRPARLATFIALRHDGLNTIELDVKNEAGRVAFVPATVPLARAGGQTYYRPWASAAQVHAAGLYLVGRIVAFQDRALARAHPELALHDRNGRVWRGAGGTAWLNPYDRRVWIYLANLGAAAARAGFDEIQYDYVRFPSDGDLRAIRYPSTRDRAQTIAAFLRFAARRLHPLGVRVGAAVFGLSATLDVGVAQDPHLIALAVDDLSPMLYPSHYLRGNYGLRDPNASPGATVAGAMADFRRATDGTRAHLVPWLQDFSLGRAYGAAEVAAQVDAAREGGAAGFLLWNHEGRYNARSVLAEAS